ncbi:hypothetical protein L596_023191 [Steinernema carpocapsae]|uniref:Uncharacterized protein n=1 Tax=Steinernema carpocapsae TaxID=34508 RepID=A0A4U5MCY2_STECR|nr:hypothetical protein L596_023191 [Steinernema carpocapsae]
MDKMDEDFKGDGAIPDYRFEDTVVLFLNKNTCRESSQSTASYCHTANQLIKQCVYNKHTLQMSGLL